MTCIIQDPEGRFSIWAEPADEHGLIWYEVRAGDASYFDVETLAEALAMVGLGGLATGDAVAGFIAAEEG